jgi:hypothetical protein
MINYKVVAVLWDDHVYVDRSKIPQNPDDEIVTVLSIGILYKETDKSITLVNSIERMDDRDDACYTIILRSTIQGIQNYGEIELAALRE